MAIPRQLQAKHKKQKAEWIQSRVAHNAQHAPRAEVYRLVDPKTGKTIRDEITLTQFVSEFGRATRLYTLVKKWGE